MKTKLMINSGRITMLACLALLVQTASAPDLNGPISMYSEDFVNRLKKLATMTDKERASLVEGSGNALRHIQETLLNQLASGDTGVKCYAAFLLGQYRFGQGASSLAQAIALHEEVVRPNGREWFWDRYPAFEALIKIGNPAISPAIRNLEESDDPEIKELSLKVIYYIENRDKEIVQLRLKKALSVQENSKRKGRIESALETLLDPKFGK